jgi:hypothetical protein
VDQFERGLQVPLTAPVQYNAAARTGRSEHTIEASTHQVTKRKKPGECRNACWGTAPLRAAGVRSAARLRRPTEYCFTTRPAAPRRRRARSSARGPRARKEARARLCRATAEGRELKMRLVKIYQGKQP